MGSCRIRFLLFSFPCCFSLLFSLSLSHGHYFPFVGTPVPPSPTIFFCYGWPPMHRQAQNGGEGYLGMELS